MTGIYLTDAYVLSTRLLLDYLPLFTWVADIGDGINRLSRLLQPLQVVLRRKDGAGVGSGR